MGGNRRRLAECPATERSSGRRSKNQPRAGRAFEQCNSVAGSGAEWGPVGGHTGWLEQNSRECRGLVYVGRWIARRFYPLVAPGQGWVPVDRHRARALALVVSAWCERPEANPAAHGDIHADERA